MFLDAPRCGGKLQSGDTFRQRDQRPMRSHSRFVNIPVRNDEDRRTAGRSYRIGRAPELTAEGADGCGHRGMEKLELDPANAKPTPTWRKYCCGRERRRGEVSTCQQGAGDTIPAPAQAEIDLGIESVIASSSTRALESPMRGAAFLRQRDLARRSDDAETWALAGCALHQTRRQMRGALAKFDCQAALSLANKVLAAQLAMTSPKSHEGVPIGL